MREARTLQAWFPACAGMTPGLACANDVGRRDGVRRRRCASKANSSPRMGRGELFLLLVCEACVGGLGGGRPRSARGAYLASFGLKADSIKAGEKPLGTVPSAAYW